MTNKIMTGKRLGPAKAKSALDELIAAFKRDLAEQHLVAGDFLPGEGAIAETYKVPLSVVRRMYGQMKEDGLVDSVRGKGVFLLKSPGSIESSLNIRGFHRWGVIAYLDHNHPLSSFNRVSGILRFFDRAGAVHNCSTRLFNTYPSRTLELELLEELRQYRPDGILLEAGMGRLREENIRKVMLLGLPVVVSGPTSIPTHQVVFDQGWIAEKGIEHLLKLGHHRIAFIQATGPESWRRERLESAARVMELHNLALTPRDIIELPSADEGRATVHEFAATRLASPVPEYTAVFCSGDIIAADLIEAAQNLNISIPQQLSVVGVDDDWKFRHLDITTIPQSSADMGRMCFEVLLEVVNTPSASPIKRAVKPNLLMRRTSGPLSGGGAVTLRKDTAQDDSEHLLTL